MIFTRNTRFSNKQEKKKDVFTTCDQREARRSGNLTGLKIPKLGQKNCFQIASIDARAKWVFETAPQICAGLGGDGLQDDII